MNANERESGNDNDAETTNGFNHGSTQMHTDVGTARQFRNVIL